MLSSIALFSSPLCSLSLFLFSSLFELLSRPNHTFAAWVTSFDLILHQHVLFSSSSSSSSSSLKYSRVQTAGIGPFISLSLYLFFFSLHSLHLSPLSATVRARLIPSRRSTTLSSISPLLSPFSSASIHVLIFFFLFLRLFSFSSLLFFRFHLPADGHRSNVDVGRSEAPPLQEGLRWQRGSSPLSPQQKGHVPLPPVTPLLPSPLRHRKVMFPFLL